MQSLIAGLFAAALATAPVLANQQQIVGAHSADTSKTSRPRIDFGDGGKVVINLDLAGDLPGMLTLNLQRHDDGTVTGEWAAVVAYSDATDPLTGIEPSHVEEHGHGDEPGQPHKDFWRLFNRGTLSGAVTAATLQFDANGVLGDMTATLKISAGTMEFAGVTSGQGTATLADLKLIF